jgi:hypothetical protein
MFILPPASNLRKGCDTAVAATRLLTCHLPSLFVSPFILTQLEQQRFRERLGIEHAFPRSPLTSCGHR